eukprot:CAMPEP_0168615500 /NCGR_PEP_ID=MMETSP0449_2-20121227/4535_1 /TAXON_ID=1082188 /ORGANISM="Strombidium rassoulzadegani, Strain ras09" /LENGTH=196 /DNA_ID=CAMNT_0008656239 /DNA_START=817 /DNA_END=1406 /DNA_ORIENTATION=-
MVGLAFYMFEGVTSVLPILEASNEEARSSFTVLLISALSILLFLNIGFSELCYYAWGSDLKEPIIIWQFPDDNLAVITGGSSSASSSSSPSLSRYSRPTTTSRDGVLGGEAVAEEPLEAGGGQPCRHNINNLLLLPPQNMGLTGVLLGSIVVLVMPSLIHNKLMATSTFQKSMNYCVIAYALVMIIVVSFFIIYYW